MCRIAEAQAEEWKRETEWFEKNDKKTQELFDTAKHITIASIQKIKDSVMKTRASQIKDSQSKNESQ